MKRILLSIFALSAAALSAQSGYYLSPCAGTGNPGNLNADPEYPVGGGLPATWSTVMSGAKTSPEWSAAQAIPFGFQFNGSDVSSFKVSSTGVLTFDINSSVAAPAAANEALPSANIPDQSVCVWGLTLNASGDYIVSKTFGTAPNRQLWLMYASATEANIGTGWSYMSIVLEESSNNIYVVDQRVQCVKNGAQCTDKTKLTVGMQIDGSTAISHASSPAFACSNNNDPTPADNRYFAFMPGTQPVDAAAATSVNLAPYLKLSEAPFTVKVDVVNQGSASLSSVDFEYSTDGTNWIAGTASGLSVATCATSTISHPTTWTPSAVGTYTVSVRLTKVNGTDVTAPTLTKTVQVVDQFVKRKILNEVFTSSTCGPCKAGNANYLTVIDGRTDHSTIKYQVWWPGTGDPYCTDEVRTRTSFYGINSVPRMEVDGGWDQNASSFTTALYDDFSAKPAFVEISATASLTWKNQITADITLNPLVDFTGSNIRLFGAIVEGTTYWNIKSNGETQFEDVMKKMMPDANGMLLTGGLAKGTPVTKQLSYAFVGNYRLPLDGTSAQHIKHASENSVETWDDLKVVIFVQDMTTKEVLQSETIELAMTSVEDVAAGVHVFPNPANEVIFVRSKDAVNASIELTNVQGQVVYTGSLNNGVCQIPTQALAEGMYVVRLATATGVHSSKVMVRH
jgi:hypothetical protein